MVDRQSRFEVLVDVFNLILGTFLALSPWIFGLLESAPAHKGLAADVLNAWTTGLTVDLAAGAAIVAFAEWPEWVNFFAGLWTIGAPWFLGFGGTAGARWVQVAVGASIAFLAGVELVLLDRRAMPRPKRTLKLIDFSAGSPEVSEFVIPQQRRDLTRHRPGTVVALPTAALATSAAEAPRGGIAAVQTAAPGTDPPGPAIA
jgi:hypothetical protein